MSDFLVFTLTAPMGSFGDLAGHERRGSSLWPGRSAIIGLLGAALGIRRDDPEGHARLDAIRVAVSVLCEGRPLRDYHTVQTVPRTVKSPNSRREALTQIGNKVNTVITHRDYRTDVCFGVAVWTEQPAPTRQELVAALERPVFSLYLGRKSCPLSAPVGAKSVAAADPVEALGQVTLPPWLMDDVGSSRSFTRVERPYPARPLLVASDPFEGLEPARSEMRWDQPMDRQLWHFSRRLVHVHLPRDDE